jgi:hypothetical protein
MATLTEMTDDDVPAAAAGEIEQIIGGARKP